MGSGKERLLTTCVTDQQSCHLIVLPAQPPIHSSSRAIEVGNPWGFGKGTTEPQERPLPPQVVDGWWAFSVRRRLATQLQETGHAEPQQVEALVAELVAVFATVLQKSSRRAWLHLMEVLRLLAPFRQLLAGRVDLLPYLEGLYYQYRSSQALVSDLDVLGAMGRAFPQDRSVLQALPQAACPREPMPLGKWLPSGPEPVFAGLPCPFASDWRLEGASGLEPPAPVSLQELQRSLGAVGSAVCMEEAPWASCLGLMALSLATDVPVEYSPCAEPSSEQCPAAPLAVPVPVRGKKGAWGKGHPMTGLQAVEAFVENRHAGRMHFLYLNVAPNRHFRPYDLLVVPKRLADPEHYIFSPFGVLHVHPEEGSEALTLGAWHREAMLWQLLQHVPFFRLFLVRKAFVRWCCSTKHLHLLKQRQMLSCQLLQAVPHFAAALLHISRLLQELRAVHWLPHTTNRCYSFVELQQSLAQENSCAQDLLHRFLTLCSSILELVREDTYKMVHRLQTQVQGQKLYVTKESLYQQRMEAERLRQRLREAESWLQQLGFLALLVNFLICQNLVSIVQEEASTFVSRTMQVDGTRRKAVLRVEVVFGPEEQLALFPSPPELESCLVGALDTMVESVLLVTRINSETPRTPAMQLPLAVSASEEDGEQCWGGGRGAPLPLWRSPPPCHSLACALDLPSLAAVQRLPVEPLSGEEPQLVHHLDLKVVGGLEVVGHRLRGQYPLLSREQLEKDLRSDSIIQNAWGKQQAQLEAALSETQHLCHEYSWLAEIYRFVHSWGAGQLEDMKGWPSEEYVNRITKLRTWRSRVTQVPRSVVTSNCLLFVDCAGIHQNLLPLLASISEDILSLLLRETTQRSELLIAEMSAVLQLYLNVSSDIFTIAKCSQKLEQYQGQLLELQESVDYVRGLNEVIQQCFRPLSSSEESLENSLLDTWDAFVYQQREVSDFIVSRRLSIIAELSSSLQKATRELQEMLATVTVGRFRDPVQNPRTMEEELCSLLQHFQATVVRVAELCRSQRILTGECMDVSFVTGNQGILDVHLRIWQLFRIVSEQITEWKCLAFFKFNATLAMERTDEWLTEAFHIEDSLPASHPVIQACMRAIKNLQKYLPLLRKLGSHFVKVSCWKEIFAAMGAKCPVNMQFTLGQLLAHPLLEHSENILRIYACEKGRYRSRDTLNRLQRFWSEKQFRLVNFILNVPYQPQAERFRRLASSRQRPAKREYISKDSGTFILSDTAELKATVEQSLLTLQNMIVSPYSSELREEAVSWTSILRSFESLLEAWVGFQQKWVFLNIVLYEMDISLPSLELESRFQQVDAHFRELMQVTCQDPLVLSSVRPALGSSRESGFVGGSLQAALTEASGELQSIMRALDYVLEATRMGFPRLFFLSNEELVAMVATAAEPADASAWSQRCFPGVRQLQLRLPSTVQTVSAFSAQAQEMQVTGLVGDHGEKLKLCAAVPLSQKATQWLCTLEQRMKETLFHKLQDCLAQRLALRPELDVAFEQPPGPTELPLHLLAEHWASLGANFPVQCVLLAEEALWRSDMEEALAESGSWSGLERKLNLKVEALTHYIRNYRSVHSWQPESDFLGVLLGGLLIITVQQRDVLSQLRGQKVSSPQAFEWARRFKYRVAMKAEKAKAARLSPERWVGNPPGCWAEVLDSCFPYDYEYLGPSVRFLGSPNLDRTFLGLLLALEDFYCGGLLGHQGAGKSYTVQGLAQALGRQLVTLQCSAQVSISCLNHYLCGAVHAGALLLLESAERLEPAVLSAFSQRLADLRQLCLGVKEGRGSAAGPSSASQASADSDGSSDSEGQPMAAVPELGMDEAEPFHPRVVGNILFGGRLLRVRETYGCVATLERLPEPLRLALRPLVVLPPDLAKLAEVSLLAAGFREASRLAGKLSAFLSLEAALGPGSPASRAALIREVVSRAINILFSPGPRQDLLLAKARPSPRTTFFLGLEEEPAIIKAVCLSTLFSGPECPRLHHTWDLLRGIFPTAALQLPELPAFPRLHNVLVAQLHENKLHPEPHFLSTALQLFQALRSTSSVLLLGPPGSGKTTTWQMLAKALSRLAANEAAAVVRKVSGSAAPIAFVPVHAVCVWPNSLSVAEFLGSLEEGVWRDGVLSRLLQRTAASALAGGVGEESAQKWVVLDGAGSAEWLEPISSLFSPRPSLSLSSGQKLQPPENIKVLFEMPDASGMLPSICTHCAVLHCRGSNLWQGVLASAMGPLYRPYSLTQQSLAMLQELAEDVFPPTLAFLQQHCSSILVPHASPRSLVAQGVQETTVFTRILRALLEQHLRREKVRSVPAQELKGEQPPGWGGSQSPSGAKLDGSSSFTSRLDEAVPAHHHTTAKSFFAFAYIWGFGGHLHPRHWPLFEQFARQTLLSSRHPIELPSAASAFDLCPLPEDGSLQPLDGRFLSCRVKNVPAAFCVLPQYERVLYVLDLLLGANQPVLLTGEPGGGKTSFAEMLVQPNHSCQRVCVSLVLKAAHLRRLLLKKSREKGPSPLSKPAWALALKGRCLFLVEDLHLSPLDPGRGTSPMVETLRQALAHQQFYHPDTLELQHCPAVGFNCFGTLSVPVLGAMPLCPRFGRLFSTVVLPPLTREALLSMHTPATLAWLEKFPLLTRHNDLAAALVKASLDAYEAVKSQFPPSPACCLFHFSLHSLRQLFKGLFLLRPRPGIHLSCPLEEQGVKMIFSRRSSAGSRMAIGPSYTVVLIVRLIVRLWLHEALRIFGDPLRGEHLQAACGQLLLEIAMAHFCTRRPFLRIIPSLGALSAAEHPPSHSHVSFYPSSLSRSCATWALGSEEEGEEEGLEPEDRDFLPDPQALLDFPGSSVEAEQPDPWDPVLQAPPLALEPAQWGGGGGTALGELEREGPKAEPEKEEEEEGEGGRKVERVPSGPTPDRRQPQHEHHPPLRHARAKRRPSSKKESSGPLLPAHLLLSPGELPGDIVFSKELDLERRSPGAHNPYQERLWRALESQLAPSLPPHFLLSSAVLRHVVHLSRLLCGVEQHGALVAFRRNTGRQTLVALAAQATASVLMELPAEASEGQVLALLRLASWKAGVQGQRVLLLVPPALGLGPLHLVLALMAEGTCPGLYEAEDTAPIVQALLQEQQALKRTMREDLVLQRFFQSVRHNLHVVLLLGAPSRQGSSSLGLPPLTSTVLSHLLGSLKVCQAWSLKALREVASKHLQSRLGQASWISPAASSLQAHQNLVLCVAKVAALIHSSAATYSTYLDPHLPLVTPRSFLDLLNIFVWLLFHLKEKTGKRLDQMRLALHKMGEVSEKQQAHSRDVHALQEKLNRIKQQMLESQQEVEQQQLVLQQQEKECQQYEERIDALTKERDELEKAKELAMKKMSKDYREALAGLRAQDVEELRSYRQPPEQVVWVTDILCKLFGEKPGWEAAKEMLSREDFYQELVFYPKDTISTDLFQALGMAVAQSPLRVPSIRRASHAAMSLWQWICAIYFYHRALRSWQPSLERLERCDAQINSEKMQLGHSRLRSEHLRDATQARIKELKETQRHQQRLLHQLTQSLQAREEASTVENSVAEHLANWTVATQVLEHQQSTVFGDSLLCAATVTYLGPFPPARRAELLRKWQALCAGSRVSLGPDDVSQLLQQELPCPGSASCGPPLLPVQQPFRPASLLSSAREQRCWDRTRKPEDPESRLAALLLYSEAHRQGHRWLLLVDPDKQATIWLLMASTLGDEDSQTLLSPELVPDMGEQGDFEELPEDNVEVLSLTDPDLEQNLLTAARVGTPVLLVDFEKNIPWSPVLQQLMQKETLQEASQEMSVAPSFELYLCTKLPLEALAAEMDPRVLKSLNVIDLSLGPAALEELLLGEVLCLERREILKHRQALQLGVVQLEAKLEATEEELVELISQPQRSLLEEENFMPMVQLLQTQIQALRATHQHMVSLYQDQAALCNKYRPVAHLGLVLRQALLQVGRLHPLYHFPFEDCIRSMRQALLSTKRPDLNKQETLEAHLLELSRAVLRHQLMEALPSLRVMDRLVYLFLGALASLQAAGDISPLEHLAFFQGFREPMAKELLQPQAGVPRPDWVSEEAWEECRLLESLPGFQGLPASLAERPDQWQEYFRLPSTVVGLALCPSHTHLSPFQRAILWRILCPEAMSSVICDLTTCLLGWTPTENVVITQAYAYSRANKPVIFLTPPAGSLAFTHPLHWIEQMAQQRGRAGKVVVISFGTSDAGNRVWRMLPFCARKGKWLVLNNCHLQEQWDPEVLLQLDQVLNVPAGDVEGAALEIHPKFRLWLITAADAPGSVPGPVQRTAVVLFCEMALELKGILAQTHQLLQGQVQGLDTDQRLLLLLLYAILHYRQAYSRWTQAESYLWSHVELWEGFKAQERLGRLPDSPKEALQELAGIIPYGGHILDRGDAEAVQSLSRQCLASDRPQRPRPGLPSLLAAVRGTPNPRLSEEEAAAATQARIQHLPSPMEPAWVGLCNGLQRELLASRSRAMLEALQVAQGRWQPPRLPSLQQEGGALEELVGQALELMQELQEQLEQCGWEVGARGHPPMGQPRPKPRPLQRFLLEEAGSFLALLQQMQRDLQCGQEHLRGSPCSSPRCATLLRELKQGRVPQRWLHYTPTSPPHPPPAWLQALRCRSQLLCHYLRAHSGAPYHLAAFHHPQRLFLALRQEMARAEKQEMDRYSLEVQVLPTMLPPSNAPDKGLYLMGLELHHALWDTHSCRLQETRSGQPCQLPAVRVQATFQPWETPSEEATYQCPVFLGTPAAFVPLRSQEVVMHVALPSQLAPEVCAQRRVHAVSVLPS
ncbi:dynein heavy chain domain-containing protein 1 [Heteronotia binoei]|uniref:dynein heavy chain domain-containing protein 1 n=1 Tax=Heteronotia binoei TaxID=13085 RepID=UPI00292DA820|nr:dynein heavy chain domain-containing protein 1 [Heteronotia binoei]